jgi:ribosomal protein S18 acetylase RimI-like enzyme
MLIDKVGISELSEALKIYHSCVCQHKKSGFNQWDESYPSKEVVERDILKGYLFGAYAEGALVGLIAITKDEPKEYKKVDWKERSSFLIIHRLCVNELFLRKGIANKLMTFAEKLAKNQNYLSIRLDTFSLNKGAVFFYEKIGYSKVGYVNFPKRKDADYTCFEKIV